MLVWEQKRTRGRLTRKGIRGLIRRDIKEKGTQEKGRFYVDRDPKRSKV